MRRRRRQVDSAKPHIAAKLEALPETFTLGDEKYYNGFYNKPLSSHQQYQCFVLAALKDQDSVSAAPSGGQAMLLTFTAPSLCSGVRHNATRGTAHSSRKGPPSHGN